MCQVENWENELLCHIARMEWTKNGDCNSKFYHSVIKERRKCQKIQLAHVDRSIISDPREIGAMAQELYLENQLFENCNCAIIDIND